MDPTNTVERDAADHSWMLDVIGGIAGSTSEEQVAERSLDLYQRLLAPAHLVYHSIGAKGIRRTWTVPAHVAPAGATGSSLNLDGATGWVDHDRGLRVVMTHRSGVVGVLVAAGVVPWSSDAVLHVARTAALVIGVTVSSIRLCEALGDQAGEMEALTNNSEQVERRLRYLGTHDVLTGLYNRTFFDEELARLEHSRRFPISIVVADVSRLVRPDLGTDLPAADRLLHEFSQILELAFRGDDVLARIAPDRFAVLLPDTNVSLAGEIQERVRRAIGEHSSMRDHAAGIVLGAATAEKGEWLVDALAQAGAQAHRGV